MRPVPIGVDDFRVVREQGMEYVDKSRLIQEVIDQGAQAILLPRPRRFGKTLNLSMLRRSLEHRALGGRRRIPVDTKLFPLRLGGVVGFEAVNRNGPIGGTAAHFNALIIRAYRIGLFQFRCDAKWISAVFEEEAILAICGGPARR
jgi:hypothetical protein